MKRSRTLFVLGFLLLTFPLGASSCSSDEDIGKSTKKDMAYTEKVATAMQKAVPPPELKTSNERLNLKRRLERWNTETKEGYIYLLAQNGTVVGHYVTKGKPSSLNSYLTTNDQVVTVEAGTKQAMTIEAPDLDGTYGKNSDGIFFFTADTDAYVEWKGEYLFTDQPMKLQQQPLMVRQIEK